MTEKDDLQERVRKFSLMQLPGQPVAMHMGTSYLVHDLWLEVNRLSDRLVEIERQVRDIGGQFRRNAEAADNQGRPAVADHLRYAARTVEAIIDAPDAGGED